MLLTSFAGWAGIAWTVPCVVERDPLKQVTQAGDVQYIKQPGENVQTIYLVKLLQGSSQFRVRAQAAISLGTMQRSLAARDALTIALRDVQPGVRAAAAMSLGGIGDANHIVALSKLGGDPEAPVRNAARASIGRLEHAQKTGDRSRNGSDDGGAFSSDPRQSLVAAATAPTPSNAAR